MARVRASARPRMRGAAVLFIVMLLLLSAGLLAYYAARVSLTEQRLSANDVLAHEAQSAAQAGLEAAFGALAWLELINPIFDADGGLTIDGPAATLSNGAAFTTRWHNQGLTPGDTAMLRIEARGIASDAIGMRVAHQLARRDPWLAQAPPAPLVARGAVTLGENGIIDSGAHPYAIWSGGGVSLPGSMTIEVGGAALCGFNGVCDEDERLAQLSAAAFMTNFFGRPPELMAAQSTTIACVSCAVDALAVVVRPAWIEGDAGVVTLAGGTAGAPELLTIIRKEIYTMEPAFRRQAYSRNG